MQAARRVHGLYTAQVLDADPDAAPPWLVTAYVPGPSLRRAVAEHDPMPAQTVFLLMAGVAEALAAIHAAGIVHRDLKPSNVLLAPDGPRVIDFGIARAAEATAVTRTGIRVGSPQYMAPEQILDQPVAPAIDIFALGSLAAYAALGRSPFGEGSDAAVLYRVVHEPADLRGCPAQLAALIERCLAKQPAARPTPGQVINTCQARTASQAIELAWSWLPPAMAAAMPRHPAPPPAAHPANQPAAPAAEAPTGVRTRAADGPPYRRGPRFSHATMVTGLAAATLAAVAIVTLLALRSSPHAHGRQASAAVGSSRQRRGTGLAATASMSPSPSPAVSPTQSPGLDSCLFGSWKGVSEDVVNHINSQPVTFTGRGADQVFTPDGRYMGSYGKGVLYSATFNGNRWTEMVQGKESMDYQTQGGRLLFSNAAIQGSLTLYENGAYNNSAPLSLVPGPESYTCSGNTLREYVSSGALELTRLHH